MGLKLSLYFNGVQELRVVNEAIFTHVRFCMFVEMQFCTYF